MYLIDNGGSGGGGFIQRFDLGQYVLKYRKPIRAKNDKQWSKFFESHKRRVRQTFIGDYCISNIFLGIDHNFSGGKPILFETMIFPEDESGYYMERCCTWRDALRQHWRAVDYVKTRS